MSILDFISLKSSENETRDKRGLINKKTVLINKNINNKEQIKVFTDGACINNGRKNAKAGIGIYFGENDFRNVSERITDKQSNNTAELKAILKVYVILKDEIENKKSINIYSDSIYAIRCCGEYGFKMNNSNWRNKNILIPNHELVKEAFNLFYNKHNIKLIHVKAHTDNTDELSVGNAHADRLASESIGSYIPNSKAINTTQYVKIYLNVPFLEKDAAKKAGAKWDNNKKKWYYFDSAEDNNKKTLNELFKK
jgi:ribonuclease HI